MRFSSCNCHYPHVCRSKSSIRCGLPKSRQSQCRDGQNDSAPVPIVSEEKNSDERIVIEQKNAEDVNCEILPKSSLKKPRNPEPKQVVKGNVKWMDLTGKELSEIKEFEPLYPISSHSSNLKKKITPMAMQDASVRFNDEEFFTLDEFLRYYGPNVQLLRKPTRSFDPLILCSSSRDKLCHKSQPAFELITILVLGRIFFSVFKLMELVHIDYSSRWI
ncbi:hypothetical protein ZIOFF_067522 [Zingiber officinale]|uniref:Uncharacterized protein n=1 Tax=Zingiber officinale TaxID=94328 RepID=A0A8J5C5V4_ZINOF|nr:hypothetical protein ZIOFF_067522 [Zingiber officinale]